MTAAAVARALGGAKQHGGGWLACCPVHDDRIPSLSLVDGDRGRLLLKCFAGCDTRDIFRVLMDRGLLASGTREFVSPKIVVGIKENTNRASALWKESVAVDGTAAMLYLRSRGITHPLPPSLRFHPAVYHGLTKRNYPALIAAVTRWPDDAPHAVHRTFLCGNKKADITPNKMMLGTVSGGAVKLAPVMGVLAVAEGIETALSFQQETGIPTWAVLSASNYQSLVLPELVRSIVIAADHDPAGLCAAYGAADLWTKRALTVRVVYPPAEKQDFNDLIKGY